MVNVNIPIPNAHLNVIPVETEPATQNAERVLQIVLRIVDHLAKTNAPIQDKPKKDALVVMFKKELAEIMIQTLVLNGHLGKQFRIVVQAAGQTNTAVPLIIFKENM